MIENIWTKHCTNLSKGPNVCYYKLEEVRLIGFNLNCACKAIWPDAIVFPPKHVKGKGDSLIELQFTDDSTLFVEMEKKNFINLVQRQEVYCNALISEIVVHKFNVLSWNVKFPNWMDSKNWQWIGPDEIYQDAFCLPLICLLKTC